MAKHLAIVTLGGTIRSAVMLPNNCIMVDAGDDLEIVEMYGVLEVKYVIRLIIIRCGFD